MSGRSPLLLSMAMACSLGTACAGSPSEATDTTPPTAEEIAAFSDALPGTDYDYEPAETAEEIATGIDTVVIGTVVGASEGRKEFLDVGSTDLLYFSYVNLVIAPAEVQKGELPSDGNVHLEFTWPISEAIDRFVKAAPIGARVIVAGDLTRDADERAEPLREAGMTVEIAPNLIQTWPMGFIIESADGLPLLPMEGNRPLTELLKSDREGIETFDDAVEALRR